MCFVAFMIALSCTLFFFNDTAPTEIYTLSLHDALPIYGDFLRDFRGDTVHPSTLQVMHELGLQCRGDRKSTRLNSSHTVISYAVFCLKKKKTSERWRPSPGWYP